jgi:CDP-glycerol glycerophosphotransferase (TagB/SpsB family)
MITDYSSIVFDFVYLGRPIMYFVPDYELFKAGVTHDYNALDLPLEEAFGALSVNAKELLIHLEKLITNDMQPDKVFADRCRDFFITKKDHCDQLYKLLTE